MGMAFAIFMHIIGKEVLHLGLFFSFFSFFFFVILIGEVEDRSLHVVKVVVFKKLRF